MTVIEKKEALRRAIDTIEDEQSLDRMLDIAHEKQTEVSPELIALLEERERKLATGEAKLVPWKEVDAKIRSKYGFPR